MNHDLAKLTPREQQVLDLLIERGSTNKQIARNLHIVESTVKLHMSSILKKYGAKNRTQLMVFARKD
jgi:two-component system nitrate/nitrite response regulator NarL